MLLQNRLKSNQYKHFSLKKRIKNVILDSCTTITKKVNSMILFLSLGDDLSESKESFKTALKVFPLLLILGYIFLFLLGAG